MHHICIEYSRMTRGILKKFTSIFNSNYSQRPWVVPTQITKTTLGETYACATHLEPIEWDRARPLGVRSSLRCSISIVA